MFSTLYCITLVILTGVLLRGAFALRGGPVDYIVEDSVDELGLGSKAYNLLRKRNRIENIKDQFAQYVALVEWKEEALAFNELCETQFLNRNISNLIQLPLE
ncbi:hypothetical protein [Pseudoalteromonas rubra]|uniref:Uncharacterized protein n=1 Tax=Pseudoalteromonas rubra TaxID=43658 RepID=A0A0F4QCK2_9GAMM|nr:hypothetical protein [Pseudoalteromonas rubra]KJZ04342.1 hypothetical protein TW77_23550 [Pseudoalteromonas rubra]